MEYDGTMAGFLTWGGPLKIIKQWQCFMEVHGFEAPQCVFDTAIKLSLKLSVCTLW